MDWGLKRLGEGVRVTSLEFIMSHPLLLFQYMTREKKVSVITLQKKTPQEQLREFMIPTIT